MELIAQKIVTNLLGLHLLVVEQLQFLLVLAVVADSIKLLKLIIKTFIIRINMNNYYHLLIINQLTFLDLTKSLPCLF